MPLLQLSIELGSSCFCEAVELRLSPALTFTPRAAHPDLQHLFAHLLNPFGDGPSVHRLERDGLKNQQVQGSLNQVRWLAHRGEIIPKSITLGHLNYLQQDNGIKGRTGVPATSSGAKIRTVADEGFWAIRK